MSTAVVIGYFDGVHRGHQALLAYARTAVGAAGRVIAVTFDPHPTAVLAPERTPLLLADADQRVDLLKQAGADDVVVIAFTAQLASWSPEQFVDDILLPLQPNLVCVGGNFRFGRGASGDALTLSELGQTRGFVAHAVTLAGEGDVLWSSSRIRALVAVGDVATAATFLGRDYSVHGTVVHGDARGRDLGFPTANLAVPASRAVPADGVYAGWLDVRGNRYAAAISIGTNPQFEGTQRRVEAHALDVSSIFDIYGEHACVSFISRLRGQQVYSDVDALVAAIARDVDAVRELCSSLSN